jgi:O-antigen ligase
MLNRSFAQRVDWLTLAFVGLSLSVGTAAAVVALNVSSPLRFVVIIVGLLGIVGALTRIEWGLLALVFMTYTRFSDVLVQFDHFPSTAQPFVALLIIVVLAHWVLYGRAPGEWKQSALLVAGYGLVGYVSLLYAANFALSQAALSNYVKDAIIAILVTMLLVHGVALRHVIWTLLLAGIFMGSISVFQQLTGSFSNNFFGFGQASLQNIVGQNNDYRIGGPIGDPNFYAQILVVLVPLALDRLWHEHNRLLRLLAGWALLACGLSIIFTYSRGGFIATIVVAALMLIRRPPNLLALLVTAGLIITLLQFIPANYTQRLSTLLSFVPESDTSVSSEISLRGRQSENEVAWLMFTDHPILGVGLDNFKVYYQEYSRRLGIDPRAEARDPHNLYLQIAAQTGLVGLIAFGTILWVMFRGLQSARMAFAVARLPQFSSMTMAFGVGMIGYLIAALFLHNAYPRFFWMLFGIALAIPQIAKYELSARGLSVHGAQSE